MRDTVHHRSIQVLITELYKVVDGLFRFITMVPAWQRTIFSLGT